VSATGTQNDPNGYAEKEKPAPACVESGGLIDLFLGSPSRHAYRGIEYRLPRYFGCPQPTTSWLIPPMAGLCPLSVKKGGLGSPSRTRTYNLVVNSRRSGITNQSFQDLIRDPRCPIPRQIRTTQDPLAQNWHKKFPAKLIHRITSPPSCASATRPGSRIAKTAMPQHTRLNMFAKN
jgi:hypothetical protein